MLYDVVNERTPFSHGPLDPRLVSLLVAAYAQRCRVLWLIIFSIQGTSSKISNCATCQQPLQFCTGHFGHVRLPLPAFHIGYLRFIMTILQNICKVCATRDSLAVSKFMLSG